MIRMPKEEKHDRHERVVAAGSAYDIPDMYAR
jgi:hypothetical protein